MDQSTRSDQDTLLIADYVGQCPSGQFFVTGTSPEQPFAQNVEIFLRHEYCGKPEDGFDADFDAAERR